jgi:hypothetical protein
MLCRQKLCWVAGLAAAMATTFPASRLDEARAVGLIGLVDPRYQDCLPALADYIISQP